jgi:hypothetical protein
MDLRRSNGGSQEGIEEEMKPLGKRRACNSEFAKIFRR